MFSSSINSFSKAKRADRDEEVAMYFSTKPGFKFPWAIRRLRALYKLRRLSMGMSAWERFRITALPSSLTSLASALQKKRYVHNTQLIVPKKMNMNFHFKTLPTPLPPIPCALISKEPSTCDVTEMRTPRHQPAMLGTKQDDKTGR